MMKEIMNKMEWTRTPKAYNIWRERIEVTTEPHTDLWQRTYYHFRNDNAPVLQMETDQKFFSFVVRTDFSGSHHRFDQCGIVMYLDSENWLKASVEYENEGGKMTIALNAHWTVKNSARCASAICGKEPGQSVLGSTPAARRIPVSRPCFLIWRCGNAHGKPMTDNSQTKCEYLNVGVV